MLRKTKRVVKEILNPWRPVTELPVSQKDNPNYSYDLILDDGARQMQGYYSYFDGANIFLAFNDTILLPIIRWKYLRKGAKRG